MKHIYTSPLCGWDESADCVYVYEFENDDEIWDFEEMTFEEKCDLFNVYEEPKHSVAPGAIYHRYDFCCTGNHAIVTETVACNV